MPDIARQRRSLLQPMSCRALPFTIDGATINEKSGMQYCTHVLLLRYCILLLGELIFSPYFLLALTPTHLLRN